MSRRRGRPHPAIVIATVAVVLFLALSAATPARASIALTPIRRVSDPSSWTVGNALARSASFLHAVWATDCPPPTGACATDTGPHVGVFWRRSAIGTPPVWGPAKRISPKREHAARPSVAAADGHVYVAWVTQRSYVKYRPADPRRLWIRVGGDQGGVWSPPVPLTAAGARVDYPVVAAAGDAVWVVWTNADDGAIKMASSPDAGAHWTTTTIGTTTSNRGAEGFAGYPAIGASGANVMAAWFATPGGRQVALTSSVGGSDWSSASVPTALTGRSPNDGTHYPVVRGADDGASDRVAVGYTTSTGAMTQIWDGTAMGPALQVDGPWPVSSGGHRWAGAYGVAAMPVGTDGVAVTWAACRRRPGDRVPCRPDARDARIDVAYRESLDGGAAWSKRRLLARARAAMPVHEAPSIVADGATGPRWFTWLSRTSRWSTYRVEGRTATSS